MVRRYAKRKMVELHRCRTATPRKQLQLRSGSTVPVMRKLKFEPGRRMNFRSCLLQPAVVCLTEWSLCKRSVAVPTSFRHAAFGEEATAWS
eukprot:IDg16082t1